MTRSSISVCGVSALVLVLASGCNKAADEQQKATNAQVEANQKIVDANQEADQKANKAQAEADQKIADAQATFLKMREDYRHDTTNKLVDLDHKIADLEAKAKTATGKTKLDLDAQLTRIRAQRAAFSDDWKQIETASAATWDATKTRLDKEWTDLKAAVDRAA
jgi:predicted double-glycine peptidase